MLFNARLTLFNIMQSQKLLALNKIMFFNIIEGFPPAQYKVIVLTTI